MQQVTTRVVRFPALLCLMLILQNGMLHRLLKYGTGRATRFLLTSLQRHLILAPGERAFLRLLLCLH